MLLMIKKGAGGRICHAIHQHAEANKKIHEKLCQKQRLVISHVLGYEYLHGWVISQKTPMVSLEWKKYNLRFNEDFINNYDEDSDTITQRFTSLTRKNEN